ncbi:hypothetical protein [Desulfitobacterium sp.]|uniref:hypothetical protein n=1 Tax=Desulfitobacterium sp. TaxID=49981 RepID=UPI002B7D5E57|nr:hypothetical protein [Desulfitobacterium sp.]HVJ49334.1 hypothetical protein [Desulfitobacterium sp.]
MNANLQIGPLVLRIQWLVIILSIFIGNLMIRYRLKRFADLEDSIKDQIIVSIEESAVIAILTWKFSVVLFDPIRIVTSPLAILYYSGGERGIGLALVVVLVYFYYHSKKEHIPIGVYGDLLAAGFLIGMVAYSVIALWLNQQRAWIYGSEILLALLLYQLYFRNSKGTARLNNLNQALTWFSLGQVFVSFISPWRQNFWWGFSQLQIVFLILAAFCIMIDFFTAKNSLIK